MNQLLEKLNEIFRDVLDNEQIELKLETNANDVEGWDSLSHIRIIVEIEKRLNIKFSSGDLSALKNIENLIATIETKQKQ